MVLTVTHHCGETTDGYYHFLIIRDRDRWEKRVETDGRERGKTDRETWRQMDKKWETKKKKINKRRKKRERSK